MRGGNIVDNTKQNGLMQMAFQLGLFYTMK